MEAEEDESLAFYTGGGDDGTEEGDVLFLERGIFLQRRPLDEVLQ